MELIDRYAYANHIRTVDPAYKAAFAFSILILCQILDRPLVGLAAVVWMWALTTFLAGLPAGVFGKVLFAEASFLLLAVAGLAVSFSGKPSDLTWSLKVGPLYIASSLDMLDVAARAAFRALGGAAAMNFLALTTPLVDQIDLMRRMRVPVLLIDIMTIIYRFIFVLLESLERMHTAQESRMGYANFKRGMNSAGLLASRLFIDAYERSQRLNTALASRGFDGDLNVLPIEYQVDWQLIGLGLLSIASLVVIRVAVY